MTELEIQVATMKQRAEKAEAALERLISQTGISWACPLSALETCMQRGIPESEQLNITCEQCWRAWAWQDNTVWDKRMAELKQQMEKAEAALEKLLNVLGTSTADCPPGMGLGEPGCQWEPLEENEMREICSQCWRAWAMGGETKNGRQY